MSVSPTMDTTLEDHDKAFTEVAFLLDIFAATIDNIMGGATASVGRIAGREMARKLPIYLTGTGVEDIIDILASRLQAGYKFRLSTAGEERELVFERCVLRDVCARRGIAGGGELCRLFHSFFDGMLNELISRPVKSEIAACGEQCRLKLSIQ